MFAVYQRFTMLMSTQVGSNSSIYVSTNIHCVLKTETRWWIIVTWKQVDLQLLLTQCVWSEGAISSSVLCSCTACEWSTQRTDIYHSLYSRGLYLCPWHMHFLPTHSLSPAEMTTVLGTVTSLDSRWVWSFIQQSCMCSSYINVSL